MSFHNLFGSHMSGANGFIAELGKELFNHKFGGDSWKITCGNSVDTPILLITLDLQDPKISFLKMDGLSELPLSSYINSDIWYKRQIYKINPSRQTIIEVSVEVTSPKLLDETVWFPNPLPEKPLKLRAMDQSDYPTNEDRYWEIRESFLGGNSFIRVSGPPLWLEYIEIETCECGASMEYITSIGYEDYNNPSGIIDDQPLFIGESALYFFLCRSCLIFHVTSQST
ncbi:MAG: hypothetical protein AB1489_43415 [Acidobacteriota bacterium]